MNRRSPPILERENPAVKAGMFRVYGVVNLYLTFWDDLLGIYLVGIQLVTILFRAWRPNCPAFRRIFAPGGESVRLLPFRHHNRPHTSWLEKHRCP